MPPGPTSYTLAKRTASSVVERTWTQVVVDRGGLERGVLAGEVQGDPDAERGELGEPAGAADAGEGGDGGRVGPGGVVDALLPAAQGHGALSVRQARVVVRARAAQLGLSVGGVDASGAGDAEGRAGAGARVVLEIPVEPVVDARLDAVGLHVAAVVAARDPVDVHGGAVGPDRLRRGVRLAEREQGVGLALHEQGGHLDPLAHRLRAALFEEPDGLRVGRAGLRDPLVHAAQVRLEPVAAAAGVDEDAGPQLLEHAVREQRVREVPVRDRRGDGVHPGVVPGREQGHRAAVGTARDAHAGVAVLVEPDLGLLREPVDQPGHVGDLAVRRVQPDLPGGLAETARRPGENRVPVPGQVLGLLPYVVLAAAEAVREQDGRAGAAGAGREVRGVQADAVAHRHDPVGAPHRGRVVTGDGRPRPGTGEHDDGGRGGEHPPRPP